MITRLGIMGVLLCGISPGQTSADNPRLKTALERFPEADSNKDGVLTLAKPNAMVLFNPAMALAADERMSKKYLERIGQGARRTKVGPAEISPLTHASAKQPPCIMFFGTAEDLLEGAELYRKDSEKAGNSCRILTYEGQGHGFFNHGARGGEHYDLTVAEMDRFLVGLGWLKQK